MEKDHQSFSDLILQRAKGHPVAHLTQKKEFWSMELQVTADTLIPRPETELLVEEALKLIPIETDFSILDLGTGTGAITLAIASERPLVKITATDISESALQIAKKNANKHNINNITFEKADWFDMANISTYDLIVSNPPYICLNDQHLKQGDVQFEPGSALISGEDGLDDIRTIISGSYKYLKPNAWLLLEHGYNQAAEVRQLFKDSNFTSISTIKDYSGNERVSIGQLAR